MAVSGTVSTTTFNTLKVIDHAYRRCRIPSQRVTAEMIDIAKDVLYLFLSSLSGQGMQLWTVDRVLLSAPQGQAAITTPVGTLDVETLLQRRFTAITGTISPVNGAIQVALDTAATVTTVGITFNGGGTYNLAFEASADGGLTWMTATTYTSTTYADASTYWFDIDPSNVGNLFRVRDLGGNGISVTTITLGGNNQEQILGRFAQDQYDLMTNKAQQGRPVQYWLDRQRDAPLIRLWPTADAENSQYPLFARIKRHIMDVGSLTNTLDIPQRWYDAVVYGLAWRLAVETPEVDPNVMMSLKSLSDEAMSSIMMEERDKSPMKISPNIGVYSK